MDPGDGPIQAFGHALGQLRKDAKLTLDDLAKLTHYSKGALSRASDGRKLPTSELLAAYVHACGGDVADWEAQREQAAAAAAASSGHTAPPALPSPPARLGGGRGSLVTRLPRRARFAALGALVLVLVLVLIMVWPAGNQATGSAQTTSLPSCAGPATARLEIAASVDKSTLLTKLASDYGLRASHGQCVQVQVQSVDSGTAMTALARGWTESDGPTPDVWSPASNVWLPLARARATTATAGLFPTQPGPSIVTSPLTIAMPEPMARALGWPRKQIGWTDLVNWAGDPTFWAQHGHPQWDPFRLGKTNPNYSTSGLNALIAAFFAATGTSDELIAADIENLKNQEFERTIEQAAVHYGDTTLTYLANLRRADDATTAANPDAALSYISAVTVEEDAVVAYNLGYPCGTMSETPGCAKERDGGTS